MQRCIVLRNGKENDEQMRNHRDEQIMERHKRRVSLPDDVGPDERYVRPKLTARHIGEILSLRF